VVPIVPYSITLSFQKELNRSKDNYDVTEA